MRSAVAAGILAVMGLRLILALVDIATWTISWRLISWLSAPFVWPLHQLEGLQTELYNRLTVGDVLATVVAGTFAAYLLASLTVREGN